MTHVPTKFHWDILKNEGILTTTTTTTSKIIIIIIIAKMKPHKNKIPFPFWGNGITRATGPLAQCAIPSPFWKGERTWDLFRSHDIQATGTRGKQSWLFKQAWLFNPNGNLGRWCKRFWVRALRKMVDLVLTSFGHGGKICLGHLKDNVWLPIQHQ